MAIMTVLLSDPGSPELEIAISPIDRASARIGWYSAEIPARQGLPT
jgi:hypothetical protein